MIENYVLSFSGGRTSAYMTDWCLKQDKYKDAVIIFTNTGKENEPTLDFVRQCDELWGNKIIWLEYDPDDERGYRIIDFETASRNGEPFEKLIRKKKYTPNRVARFCTQDLKVRVMKKYCMIGLGWEHWTNLVGIRYDEPRRWSKTKNVASKERFEVEMPLVPAKVTKPMVLEYWKKMPFDLELHEYHGNCDLCFLKGMKKKQAVLRDKPGVGDWWSKMEKEVGGTFHPDFSIEQLQDKLNRQQDLFDAPDDSIECFCGD